MSPPSGSGGQETNEMEMNIVATIAFMSRGNCPTDLGSVIKQASSSQEQAWTSFLLDKPANGRGGGGGGGL